MRPRAYVYHSCESRSGPFTCYGIDRAMYSPAVSVHPTTTTTSHNSCFRIGRASGPRGRHGVTHDGALRAARLGPRGRIEEASVAVLPHNRQRFRAELRREINQMLLRHVLLVEGRRPGRKRLRRRIPLAGHTTLRDRPAALRSATRASRSRDRRQTTTRTWSAGRRPLFADRRP